jgi:hypothetical protein
MGVTSGAWTTNIFGSLAIIPCVQNSSTTLNSPLLYYNILYYFQISFITFKPSSVSMKRSLKTPKVTTNIFGSLAIIPVYNKVRFAQFLVFWVAFCGSFFCLFLLLLLWPLYCMSFDCLSFKSLLSHSNHLRLAWKEAWRHQRCNQKQTIEGHAIQWPKQK